MTKLFPVLLGISLLLIFAAAPSFAGAGPDEVEPNDTMDMSDLIAGSMEIYGNMDAKDTDDWFYLAGQEGSEAEFTITQDEDLEVDFEVYNVACDPDYFQEPFGDMSLLDLEDYEVVGSGTGYGTESIVCEIPDACFIHIWHWEGSGDYTIRFKSLDAAATLDDYTDEDYDEIEPNDEESDADTIDDLDIYGHMEDGDVDWYKLTGQEGTNPTFTILFDDEEVEMDFRIYSDDEVVGTAAEYGSGESITCEVPGTCYIEIYHWSGEGDYIMLIEP